MLRYIRVKDYAIIEELALELGGGLTVLSGETGAGKSIIVGALGVVLGERAYAEQIRTGRKQARVEAGFDIAEEHKAILETLGINGSKDGVLHLGRTIAAGGRGRATINESQVNVQTLSEAGRRLVDIHGQHEHQGLLDPEEQLRLLDRYGRLEADREKVGEKHARLEKLKRRAEELNMSSRERAQRLDLLRFQAEEIDAAAPRVGEDEELEQERRLLGNLTKLNELAVTSYEALYAGEGSVLDRFSEVIRSLEEMAGIDEEGAGETLGVLEEARPLLEEASTSLRAIRERYDLDPARLDEVEERLRALSNLKRKYGDTLEGVLKYRERIEEELESLEHSEEDREKIEADLKEAEGAYASAAAELSKKRKRAAPAIEKKIAAVLEELALKGAVFKISIEEGPGGRHGTDELAFLFSANPGEPPKPLGRVASGGELSRIMLAIKDVMREVDDVPVLVFDEVDAGIGGRTAENVARRLKELSGGRQVICITHLAQIAARADHHLSIEKSERGGRAQVTIRPLEGEERRREVARMLSGQITETSLGHAAELLGEPARP